MAALDEAVELNRKIRRVVALVVGFATFALVVGKVMSAVEAHRLQSDAEAHRAEWLSQAATRRQTAADLAQQWLARKPAVIAEMADAMSRADPAAALKASAQWQEVSDSDLREAVNKARVAAWQQQVKLPCTPDFNFDKQLEVLQALQGAHALTNEEVSRLGTMQMMREMAASHPDETVVFLDCNR